MRRPGLALRTPAVALLVGLAAALSSRVARSAEEGGDASRAAGSRVLTLAEAERSAQAKQPQMLVARAATGVAEAQNEQARAPLLPQVTVTASYTRETGNFAPRPGAIPSTTTGTSTTGMSTTTSTATWDLGRSDNFYSLGVTGSQLIYDFGQTWDRYRSARLNADAQHMAEKTTLLQVVAIVRRAYFNARAMKALVEVAKESLDDQNRHLTQVQGFVQVGTQPPIALAQQKAAVASAEVQLITTQNNYETAKAQLNQAAGIVGGTDYDVTDEELGPVDGEDQPLAALLDKALASRPELAVLVKQREAQEASIRSAKGAYGPAFSGVLGATDQGVSPDGLVPNWSAELLMTWPIFQGGLTKGQVHQAEATLQSLEAQRSLEALQVQLDVDTARLAIRAAKATIGASDDALTSAREQLRLAEQRYATGVGSIIELTDAQLAFTSAAAQVVQARFGLATARAQLLAALGRT